MSSGKRRIKMDCLFLLDFLSSHVLKSVLVDQHGIVFARTSDYGHIGGQCLVNGKTACCSILSQHSFGLIYSIYALYLRPKVLLEHVIINFLIEI